MKITAAGVEFDVIEHRNGVSTASTIQVNGITDVWAVFFPDINRLRIVTPRSRDVDLICENGVEYQVNGKPITFTW